MPQSVPYELGIMVADGLAPITAMGFLRRLTEAVIQDTRTHVVAAPRLHVVVKQNGEELQPIAFVASATKPVSIYKPSDMTLFDLGGIIVDPKFQARGMGRKLVSSELRETGADLLGFQTQNLHMLALGISLAEYDYGLSSALAEELGSVNTMTQRLGGNSFVVEPGRYGHESLYGDAGQYRKQGMAIRDLNYTNGDAVVFVGKVRSNI